MYSSWLAQMRFALKTNVKLPAPNSILKCSRTRNLKEAQIIIKTLKLKVKKYNFNNMFESFCFKCKLPIFYSLRLNTDIFLAEI